MTSEGRVGVPGTWGVSGTGLQHCQNHSTVFYFSLLPCTILYFMHCTILYLIVLYRTVKHLAIMHCNEQHCTPLHCTALQYTKGALEC